MRSATKGQVDRFTWAVLLLLLGVFLLIDRQGLNWIGLLIAAGVLLIAAIYKQVRGWGRDVFSLIFGAVIAALGVRERFAVDIPWVAIASIVVSVLLLFWIFRPSRKRKEES